MTGPLPADPALALGQVESMTYLGNQLLRDSDWASMDHGLELRTPFVDHALLCALSSVLGAFRGGVGKRALAAAPAQPIPAASVAQAKTGFGVPLGAWLAPDLAVGDHGGTSRRWARRVLAARGIVPR